MRQWCGSDDEYEIVKYGITILLEIVVGVLLAIVSGIVWKCLPKMLLFIIFFVSIRVNAGGLHMKSACGCLAFSSIVFCIVSAFFQKCADISMPIGCVIGAALLIYIFSPVEDFNKKLYQSEKKLFKKRTMIILIIEMLVWIMLRRINKKSLNQTVELSFVIEALSILLDLCIKLAKRFRRSN